ncbi:MAG TPA: CHAD domain-containing protein [Chitinophagaceae bacterium]|nr:CHAD domain-containing protein [Chitinophagaceae bacterium]
MAENIIRFYYSKLAGASQQMAHAPGKKIIHSLRVDVKKLRAFCRLLSLEKEEAHTLKLPRRLKKMYARAGIARDLQLQIKNVEDYSRRQNIHPGSLLAALRYQLKKQRQKKRPVLGRKYFDRKAEKTTEQLPIQLRAATVQLFFRQKKEAIGHIIEKGSFEPDELHTIRKNIKDILYTTRIYTEDAGNALPPGSWKAGELESLEALADELGKYNDIGSSLAYLQHISTGYKGKDKKAVLSYYQSRIQEQKTLRPKIIASLRALLTCRPDGALKQHSEGYVQPID